MLFEKRVRVVHILLLCDEYETHMMTYENGLCLYFNISINKNLL
jgi:hypothetical protein